MKTETNTLAGTLGNEAWLRANEDRVKALFPETWTHVENLGQEGMMRIGFNLKLLGVDWRSEKQFGQCMVFFEKLGFLQRQNGYQVRRNPSRVMG